MRDNFSSLRNVGLVSNTMIKGKFNMRGSFSKARETDVAVPNFMKGSLGIMIMMVGVGSLLLRLFIKAISRSVSIMVWAST